MHKVSVDKEGVGFGDNFWVSHESITGCAANLIPQKCPQYWEWVLCANTIPIPKKGNIEYNKAMKDAAEKCERRAESLREGSAVARQCALDILAALK